MNHDLQVETNDSGGLGHRESTDRKTRDRVSAVSVALLTGGSDKHYVYGLSTALGAKGAMIDLIGSDELDEPELRATPGVNFVNLRGDQRQDVNLLSKVIRVSAYYAKLIH